MIYVMFFLDLSILILVYFSMMGITIDYLDPVISLSNTLDPLGVPFLDILFLIQKFS
jgi:hypothetical protein